jgi:hypothetical protein
MGIIKFRNLILGCTILCTLLVINLNSQTTPCDVSFKGGSGIYRTRLIGLHEDLLLVSDTGNYKIINVDKVSGIKFDNGNYFWTGAAIGAAVGFVGGIVLYDILSSKKKNFIIKDPTLGVTVVFAIPASLIGSLVGLAFRNIDDYDLTQMHPYAKSKEIKFIMNDHLEWR